MPTLQVSVQGRGASWLVELPLYLSSGVEAEVVGTPPPPPPCLSSWARAGTPQPLLLWGQPSLPPSLSFGAGKVDPLPLSWAFLSS